MKTELATLGAGCFWGVEHILKQINGVIGTTCGYMGGHTQNPTYRQVCTGETFHAEVVQVEFDPTKITYKELLGYFWRLHDPTQKNRQGVDVGTQYRSAIFYHSEEQNRIAQLSKQEFDASGVFSTPSVTEIVAVQVFYSAEDYHQDYFDNNPGYVCHILREK